MFPDIYRLTSLLPLLVRICLVVPGHTITFVFVLLIVFSAASTQALNLNSID